LRDDAIINACHKEDNGLYICIAKRGQLDTNIRESIDYVLKSEGAPSINSHGSDSQSIICDGSVSSNKSTLLYRSDVTNLTGEALYAAADCAYNLFWKTNRGAGATCDFGGTGVLAEVNFTDTDYYNDDVPNDKVLVVNVEIAELVGLISLGIVLGTFIGFATAMRCSKNFNAKVSHTALGRTMQKNPLLSKSFGGFKTGDYTEIPSTRHV